MKLAGVAIVLLAAAVSWMLASLRTDDAGLALVADRSTSQPRVKMSSPELLPGELLGRRDIAPAAPPRSSQKAPRQSGFVLPEKLRDLPDLGRLKPDEKRAVLASLRHMAGSVGKKLQRFERRMDDSRPEHQIKRAELQHAKAVRDAFVEALTRGEYVVTWKPVLDVEGYDIVTQGVVRDGRHASAIILVRRGAYPEVQNTYDRWQQMERAEAAEIVRLFNRGSYEQRIGTLEALRMARKRRTPRGRQSGLVQKYVRRSIRIDHDNALLYLK